MPQANSCFVQWLFLQDVNRLCDNPDLEPVLRLSNMDTADCAKIANALRVQPSDRLCIDLSRDCYDSYPVIYRDSNTLVCAMFTEV